MWMVRATLQQTPLIAGDQQSDLVDEVLPICGPGTEVLAMYENKGLLARVAHALVCVREGQRQWPEGALITEATESNHCAAADVDVFVPERSFREWLDLRASPDAAELPRGFRADPHV